MTLPRTASHGVFVAHAVAMMEALQLHRVQFPRPNECPTSWAVVDLNEVMFVLHDGMNITALSTRPSAPTINRLLPVTPSSVRLTTLTVRDGGRPPSNIAGSTEWFENVLKDTPEQLPGLGPLDAFQFSKPFLMASLWAGSVNVESMLTLT